VDLPDDLRITDAGSHEDGVGGSAIGCAYFDEWRLAGLSDHAGSRPNLENRL